MGKKLSSLVKMMNPVPLFWQTLTQIFPHLSQNFVRVFSKMSLVFFSSVAIDQFLAGFFWSQKIRLNLSRGQGDQGPMLWFL
jgi:hypothetical protein